MIYLGDSAIVTARWTAFPNAKSHSKSNDQEMIFSHNPAAVA